VSDFDILLAAIAGAPALVGARCRGKAHLFDGAQPGEKPEVVAQRHNQALGFCGRCEAAERCRDYFNGLPRRKRPTGVVAGQVHQPARPGRPRKAAS
jgi:WhiB family redox-sensing transcriptional regulator